ncbi:MAG: hypothetical protein GEV07_16790 [Streptosporangiales bacterium]|nr:hypothetical protein [Streptosporangiales bacterium]
MLDTTGRCLIQVYADGSTGLPGGVPNPGDVDQFATLRREAWEENQVVVTEVGHLGYQEICPAGAPAYALVALVGRICRFEARRPDPNGGETYHRYLAPLADVRTLLGAGMPPDAPTAAAKTADRLWRLPVHKTTTPADYAD